MKKRILSLALALLTVAGYPLLARSEEPAPVPAEEPAAVETVPADAAVETTAAEETPAEVPVEEVPAETAPADAVADTPAPQVDPAVANQFEIFVNGTPVPEAHSMLEKGVTYVAIEPVTRALYPDSDSTWAGGYSDVVIYGPGFDLSYNSQRPYLICNGRYLYYSKGVRLHPHDSAFLVPVRVLAKALGAQVDWDAAGVHLTSGTPIEAGQTFYNATDLDLLSRIIRHESGNQPLAGKIAVAQCILNRVKAGSKGGFANTVKGVIYQKNQFPGATNATAKAEDIIAAKLAMDGADVVGNAKWFNGVGKSCWASRNKRLIANIGGHSFYG